MSSRVDICDRLLAGAKNMLTKRLTEAPVFEEVKTDVGTAFRTDDILVFIPPIEDGTIIKVKNEMVQMLYALLESLGMDHAILIHHEVAPQANELLTTHAVYTIEMFKYKFMLYDPTAHEKTPKQYLLSPEQVAKELPNVKMSQLPSMKQSDAIARFYYWLPGSVVKIDRKEGPYYRFIVKG